MTISEKIKILCIRSHISLAELARRTGQSPQNFSAKMRRQSFTGAELDIVAKAVGCTFEQSFVLPDGEKI